MTLKQLSIRIEKNSLKEINLKVKKGNYQSISEFIRIAVLEKLKIYQSSFIFDEFVIKKRE